jgi:hypothetical protein
MRLTELDISAAAYACLQAVGITKIEDFEQYPCDKLLELPHFGALEIYEVIRELNKHKLTLPALPGAKVRVPSTPKHEVIRLRLIDGLTYEQVGQQVGLSKERVRQILRAHYGLRIKPPAVDARRRRETIERIWAS